MYGEIGKGFIHVHHIVPIHKIGKEYKINYIEDLVPVCPNCHAMLHRKVNGKELSIQELKEIINK
jgi:5-methylcytosine-specific restriction protein A